VCLPLAGSCSANVIPEPTWFLKRYPMQLGCTERWRHKGGRVLARNRGSKSCCTPRAKTLGIHRSQKAIHENSKTRRAGKMKHISARYPRYWSSRVQATATTRNFRGIGCGLWPWMVVQAKALPLTLPPVRHPLSGYGLDAARLELPRGSQQFL